VLTGSAKDVRPILGISAVTAESATMLPLDNPIGPTKGFTVTPCAVLTNLGVDKL
jgi:hypothetical protein